MESEEELRKDLKEYTRSKELKIKLNPHDLYLLSGLDFTFTYADDNSKVIKKIPKVYIEHPTRKNLELISSFTTRGLLFKSVDCLIVEGTNERGDKYERKQKESEVKTYFFSKFG